MNWRTIPFFRLALPFVAGIWLAAGQEAVLFMGLFWAFPVLFGLLWFFWQRRTGFQTRWVYGATLSVFLFLFGYQLTALHHELNRPRHFKNALSGENYVSGVIQRLRPGENSMRLILKVEHFGSSPDTLLSRTGFLLAYVDLDDRSKSLNYGDKVILKGRIRPIEPPKNPKTFDFAWYMHLNNTHFSIRADSASWENGTISLREASLPLPISSGSAALRSCGNTCPRKTNSPLARRLSWVIKMKFRRR
ncbi:MAG: ComEC/Rec2 family competence protein [Saprospiraceae bacterium]